MPSKGRPKVSCRLDASTVQAVQDQIELTQRHANCRTVLDDEIATFVERAIVEKLEKMRRSREGRKRKAVGVSAPTAQVDRSAD